MARRHSPHHISRRTDQRAASMATSLTPESMSRTRRPGSVAGAPLIDDAAQAADTVEAAERPEVEVRDDQHAAGLRAAAHLRARLVCSSALMRSERRDTSRPFGRPRFRCRHSSPVACARRWRQTDPGVVASGAGRHGGRRGFIEVVDHRPSRQPLRRCAQTQLVHRVEHLILEVKVRAGLKVASRSGPTAS
jgi:hypothetical protein